jgi:choline dehydrogenase
LLATFPADYPQLLADNSHNSITAVALKAHSSSRGTVRLTGSHPQDVLQIRKNRFQDADQGYQDVVDLREAIKRARKLIMGSAVLGPYIEKEIFPGEDVKTDEEIEEHVYKNIFGKRH